MQIHYCPALPVLKLVLKLLILHLFFIFDILHISHSWYYYYYYYCCCCCCCFLFFTLGRCSWGWKN